MNNHSLKERKTAIGLILILLFLVLTLTFSLFYIYNIKITGETISETSSKQVFTKALCNEDNSCRDFIYTCENGNLISITPTNAVIQHSADWIDPRTEDIKYKSCNS